MLKTLLDQLNATVPEARIEILCALVMLEETAALPTLTAMWSRETHPEVKQCVGWAGKQIHAAQQRGYSTVAAMVEQFRLNRLPDQKEIDEERALRQIQTQVNIEQHKAGHTGTPSTADMVGKTLRGAALGGALGGLMGVGMGAMLSSTMPQVNPFTNDSTPAPKIGDKPIVPPMPSTTAITTWLRKLSDVNAQTRQNALVQLRDFNNPAAIAPLGTVFVRDVDPAVRQAAQFTAKTIYFCAVYWDGFSDRTKTDERARYFANLAQQKQLPSGQ
jgi:hypothetical protein